jgi:preprotein translocase subunit SecF
MAGGLRRIVRGEANFNIIGRTKVWMAVSGIVMLISLGGLIGRGFNLSIDFEGGTQLSVPIAETKASLHAQDAVRALSGLGLGDVRAQIETDPTTGKKDLKVTTQKSAGANLARVTTKLAELAGQTDVNTVSTTDVGPTWGKQISSKALRGLIVFLILVTIYISIRFEPKMAAGALGALFHDLIATAGIYALTGLPVTPATVVALLTLLGYSLYDTVVVFDKIQENVTTVGGKGLTPYSEMVNRSVNQVLMRSINTSLSTLLPIGSLLFVGVLLFHASTLEDLATALFIGTLVGTYSSIFVASPILAALKEREPKYANIRRRAEAEARGEKPRRDRDRGGDGSSRPQTTAARDEAGTTLVDDGDGAGGGAGTGPTRAPIRVQRAAPKPRKKKKKKRR